MEDIVEIVDEYKEFFSMVKEFFTTVFNFNIVIAIAAGIVVMYIQVKWVWKQQELKEKKKQKAIEAGHVVIARRTKVWDDYLSRDGLESSDYHANYKYVVDGKEYKYSYMGKAYPEEEIQMYYYEDPRKIICEYKQKNYPCVFYLLPFIVMAVVGGILNQI